MRSEEQDPNEETLDEYIERMEKAVENYRNNTTDWNKMMLPRAVANLLAAKQIKDLQEDNAKT